MFWCLDLSQSCDVATGGWDGGVFVPGLSEPANFPVFESWAISPVRRRDGAKPAPGLVGSEGPSGETHGNKEHERHGLPVIANARYHMRTPTNQGLWHASGVKSPRGRHSVSEMTGRENLECKKQGDGEGLWKALAGTTPVKPGGYSVLATR